MADIGTNNVSEAVGRVGDKNHVALKNTCAETVSNYVAPRVAPHTLAHMFQDQLHNPVQKVSTMHHAL